MKIYLVRHGQVPNNVSHQYNTKDEDLTDIGINQPLEVTNREEYWNYYTDIQYGTSENIQDFFKRVYDFLYELKTKDYKKVLIVGHSGISKVFNGYFEGIQDGKFLDRGFKNCEIKEYKL